MRFAAFRILVFARAPVPGACKTRLIPSLGARGAALAHQALTNHTLLTATRAQLAPVELYCSPDPRHAYFIRARARLGLRLRRQAGGDLGRRMAWAVRNALSHAKAAVIIGTDCPALSKDYLRRACAALEKHAVVLGPADDGGYVLIGARAHAPRLFAGIAWGGSGVLTATRRRLRRLGLNWIELEPLWDVDTLSGWRRARRLLARPGP